jgi:NitT/TauT family transport system permease protein
VIALAEPASHRALAGRVGRRLREWIPAVAVFALGLAAWEWLVPALGIQRFLLPRFSAVLDSFWTSKDALWSAGWFTFKEALGGFVIGSAAGILVAVVIGRFRLLGAALLPLAIAANAVPIIAFAPITNAWFGTFNPQSKMAVAAVLCFFPVMINTLRGFQSVRPAQLELMRSYAASELTVFRRVRVPTALPFTFTALKVATVLAMIGAIVGDYFGGSTEALGIQIRASVGISQFEYAWAAIIVASLLGIAFYATVAAVERLVLGGWHASTRGPAE